MSINYIIAVITADNKKGYYTGDAIDTLRSKAKRFATKTATKPYVSSLKKSRSIKNVSVMGLTTAKKAIKKVVKKRRVYKKNPRPQSITTQAKEAMRRYEAFTGYDADSYQTVNLPRYDAGLKVGRCLGIMYETSRDGETENFLHEFKKSSQPIFAVSHDGKQIFIIGGDYIFKESGINDL